MSVDVEQRIRERAYAIWQEEGCPKGREHDHWVRAEREIADASPAPTVPSAPVAKTRATKAGTPAGTGRKPRARKAAVTA